MALYSQRHRLESKLGKGSLIEWQRRALCSSLDELVVTLVYHQVLLAVHSLLVPNVLNNGYCISDGFCNLRV